MTRVALSDVCDVRIGRTPRRDSPQFWNGEYPWTTVGELDGSVITRTKEGITKLAVDTAMPPPIPAGTLLFSFKLSIGKMAIAGTPLHTNEAIAALVIRDANELDRDYLRFALMASSSADDANHAVLGKVLNKAKVEAIRIPLPPLAQQRRIVDVLSRAEGIVRLRREAQRKAAELVPALFLHLFGDPAGNPKGWPVVRIDSLCSVQTGATPRKEEARFFGDGTIPWIKTTSVIGEPIVAAEDFITEVAVAETNCKVFPVGTILVAMYGQGQTRGRVGILAIPAATNQACAAILPGDKIEQPFLFHTLRIQYERLRAMGRGGNQANLNLSMIKELEVPLPPIELQRHFAAKADSVRGIVKQQNDALAKAQGAFEALLHGAFAQ